MLNPKPTPAAPEVFSQISSEHDARLLTSDFRPL